MWGCGGGFCCSVPQYGRGKGGRGGTHTGTHTGTYTRMLHLPFSDLPLKSARENREVQLWTESLAKKGAVETGVKRGLKMRINRD